MKTCFAYIRVSTVKQGQHGSSLQEQRDAITAFAQRHDLSISEWFDDRETAAKKGRTQFMRMMAALEKRKAAGVILHKIDRGARNLWDWARNDNHFALVGATMLLRPHSAPSFKTSGAAQ